MNVLAGIISALANKKFKDIASTFGFSVTEAYEILQKEFKRLNHGVDHRTYIARNWFDAELKDNSDLKPNEVIQKYLPTFEFIIYEIPDKKGAKWKAEYEKLKEKRQLKKIQHRVNKISEKFRRIDEDNYKKWCKYKSDSEFETLLKKIFK